MLQYHIPETELYDPESEQFIILEEKDIILLYSLNAIRLWEAKWHVPFLKQNEPKTEEQLIDFVNCMSVTGERDISKEHLMYLMKDRAFAKKLEEHISDPSTATTITDRGPKHVNNQIITSEEIYYYMSELRLPIEYSTQWHFNQLMMLINVCAIKREPPKKMGKMETMRSNAALNRARRSRMGSKG